MKTIFFILLSIFFMTGSSFAQERIKVVDKEEQPAKLEENVETKSLTQPEKLAELAFEISEEESALSELKKKLIEEGEVLEGNNRLNQKLENLQVLRKSFEQVAVKNISLTIFKEKDAPKDWQEELALVVKPLLENLRSLTEKPRKRETLKQTILEEKIAAETALQALNSIKKLITSDDIDKAAKTQLKEIRDKWERLLKEHERKQEFATIELSTLNGTDIHWFESFKTSLYDFSRDRGLTLLIALIVALVIVFFFKALTKVIDVKRAKKKSMSNRTTYRIIAYTQKLLTIVLVVIGIMVVFYVRGDVMLLALMSILIFTAALGLRHIIPRFIEESRILLNIGKVREHELVVINGVPWRVASINVFSKLINPELKGVLRLPLEDMMNLTSRKIGNEKWFPSSIGDWVLDDDNRLYEVICQGPDAVELQSAQGSNKLVSTSDYYCSGFVNLTKSKDIRITSTFGVDYSLQSICLDEVPQKMQTAVQEYLEKANIGTKNINARVEFKEAGASSLDYLIIVNISSDASDQYYRVGRYIQQACVEVCNKENWTIPFPQMTISRAIAS